MKLISIFLVLLILTSGCLEKKEISYVCHDGSVVSDPENCPELEKPAPERITIIKYVCPEGEVVDDIEECEVKGEDLGTTTFPITTTTSVISSTTTMLGTTTTTSLATTTTSTTTTSSTTTTTTIQETDNCVELGCPAGTEFVGSINSDKYHYCWCRSAKRINPDNLICFSNKEEAQSEGYTPCGVCKPPA